MPPRRSQRNDQEFAAIAASVSAELGNQGALASSVAFSATLLDYDCAG